MILSIPMSLTSPTEWLIRLPKAGKSVHDYEIQQKYWQSAIRPLFDDGNLVEQALVELDQPQRVVTTAAEILAHLDASGTRRADFEGTRIAETKWMMLVEDMRQREFGFCRH